MATLEDLHRFAVQEAMNADPRDEDEIDKLLDDRQEEYDGLEGVKKEKFDEALLDNPYDDSRIVYGGEADVDTLAVGIDIETAELLLIDRLREEDRIDGVITHHPAGRSLARLHAVMPLQIDALHNAGVPISQAEGVVRPRVKQVRQGTHGINHPRTPMAAERLDLPLTAMHTIADNHAHQFVKQRLEDEEPYRISDLIDILLDIEEYQWALEYDMGPDVFVGSEENRVGNLAFDFTGGTELDEKRLDTMANAGINTIVAMHMSREQVEEADEQHINVVAAGHMSSDSLGMNLVMDRLADEFDVDFVALAGFHRVER